MNWCTVTVAPTIEHHSGHSPTLANQRWDQVPKRPIFLEVVLFPDFWVSNNPRYFCFAWLAIRQVLMGMLPRVLHVNRIRSLSPVTGLYSEDCKLQFAKILIGTPMILPGPFGFWHLQRIDTSSMFIYSIDKGITEMWNSGAIRDI